VAQPRRHLLRTLGGADLFFGDHSLEHWRAEQHLLDGALPLDRIHGADAADEVRRDGRRLDGDRRARQVGPGPHLDRERAERDAGGEGNDEPPLAAVHRRHVIEWMKRLLLHYRILMGSDTTTCAPMTCRLIW